MPIISSIPALLLAMCLVSATAALSHAEQWSGPENPKGTIWKAAVGVVNMNERVPSDYMLVVGGKILAEEVRIN